MIEKERKEKLLRDIHKVNSYHEIQNLMGRATVALNFSRAEELLTYFALDKEDVSLEYADEGVFEGRNAVEAIVSELTNKHDTKGYMLDMQLTTPMIEVAEDGKTAKGLWWCPGIASLPQEERDPQAIWNWGMVSADFIFESDTWKIWHLHYFRFIRCSYEKGWVEDTSMINRLNTPMNELAKPTTYHNPYSPLSIREGLPACPRPYSAYTEEDKNWELNKDKTR